MLQLRSGHLRICLNLRIRPRGRYHHFSIRVVSWRRSPDLIILANFFIDYMGGLRLKRQCSRIFLGIPPPTLTF